MIFLAVLKASFSSKGSVGMTTAHPHLPLRTQPFTRLSHQRGLRLSTGLLQAHFPFLPDCLEACGTAAISWITSMNCRSNDIRGTERFNSVQSLSLVGLFATPWTAAREACLSPTLRVYPTHVHLVGDAIHLILCDSLVFLLLIFPSIRVFSNESAFHIRWQNKVSALTSVLQMNTQDR